MGLKDKKPGNSFLYLGGDDQTSEETELKAIFEELGESGGSCQVHLKRSHETAFAYVNTYRPANLTTLERLQKDFGAGEFKLRFRNDDGTFGKTALVNIGGSITSPTEKSMDVAGIIKEVKQGSGDMMPLMLQMMQSQQAQQMAMITAMMQSQAQMVCAFAGKPAPAMPEILMAKMMEQSNPLASMKMLAEMKSLFSDEPEPKDEPPTLAEKLIGMAPALISGLTGGGAGLAKPLPSVASALPVAEVPPASGSSATDGQLSPELKALLIGAAQRNADAALYCEVIFDMMGGSIKDLETVVSITSSDDGLKAVIGSVPQSLFPWFKGLAVALREFYESEIQNSQATNENQVQAGNGNS